jgi:hypothetical protein
VAQEEAMKDYKAYVEFPDEEFDTDITEAVEMMYDLVLNSMDWGSGFLETSEMIAVAKLGRLCGFEIPKCQVSYTNGKGFYQDGHGWAQCELDIDHGGKHSGTLKVRSHMEHHIIQTKGFDPETGFFIPADIREDKVKVVQEESPYEWD